MKYFLLSLIFIIQFMYAYAQDSSPESTSRLEQKYVEEIVVTGTNNRRIRKLKGDLLKAQDNMYKLFNQFNGDKSLDIFCRYRIRPGTSNIRIKICQPAYILNGISDQTQAALIGVPTNYLPVIQAEKGPKLEAVKARLLVEREEYKNAVEEYESLQSKLKTAQEIIRQ